jgi:hypothetical protein
MSTYLQVNPIKAEPEVAFGRSMAMWASAHDAERELRNAYESAREARIVAQREEESALRTLQEHMAVTDRIAEMSSHLAPREVCDDCLDEEYDSP